MENYGILRESAITRPGDDPITGILPILTISTVLITFWSALSTCTVEGFPVLPEPSFLFIEVSNFKQWRLELSERFRLANSTPAFSQVQGPPTQVSSGGSIISNITDLGSLQRRMSRIESHHQGSNPQGGGVSGG